MVASPTDETKDTALSHTSRTPPLSAALEAFADASKIPNLPMPMASTSRC